MKKLVTLRKRFKKIMHPERTNGESKNFGSIRHHSLYSIVRSQTLKKKEENSWKFTVCPQLIAEFGSKFRNLFI